MPLLHAKALRHADNHGYLLPKKHQDPALTQFATALVALNTYIQKQQMDILWTIQFQTSDLMKILEQLTKMKTMQSQD